MYYRKRLFILFLVGSILASVSIPITSSLYHEEIIGWDLRAIFMMIAYPGYRLFTLLKGLLPNEFNNLGWVSFVFVLILNAISYACVGWLIGALCDRRSKRTNRLE